MTKSMTFLPPILLLSLLVVPIFADATWPPRWYDKPAQLDNSIYSAFFGDALLPIQGFALCPPPTQAVGYGGMPIVFTEAIEADGGYSGQQNAVNPSYFRVWVNGRGFVTPLCATLAPATDATELRTVLLAGDFGYCTDTRPVYIEVVGPLKTTSGKSLQGTKIRYVIPLNAGPTLVLAERFAVNSSAILTSVGEDNQYCPAGETTVVVKLTFSGGVTGLNGASLLDNQDAMNAIQIMASGPQGRRVVLNPFALRDVDEDNHLDACLNAPHQELSLVHVAVDGNMFYSPSNVATLATMLDITYR